VPLASLVEGHQEITGRLGYPAAVGFSRAAAEMHAAAADLDEEEDVDTVSTVKKSRAIGVSACLRRKARQIIASDRCPPARDRGGGRDGEPSATRRRGRARGARRRAGIPRAGSRARAARRVPADLDRAVAGRLGDADATTDAEGRGREPTRGRTPSGWQLKRATLPRSSAARRQAQADVRPPRAALKRAIRVLAPMGLLEPIHVPSPELGGGPPSGVRRRGVPPRSDVRPHCLSSALGARRSVSKVGVRSEAPDETALGEVVCQAQP
jgi:hypothetical protein